MFSEEPLSDDSEDPYYTLAIHSGFLTYKKVHSSSNNFSLQIPNIEIQHLWENYILNEVLHKRGEDLYDAFSNISDTELFSVRLGNFINSQLSFYAPNERLEKIFHVFVLGMVLMLDYKVTSNLEARSGRYSLYVLSLSFEAVIEFTSLGSKTESPADSTSHVNVVPDSDFPLYKIEIKITNKTASVKTESL
jgi:hypothetical protein